MTEFAVETKGLGRAFGSKWAVRGLDLQIPVGSFQGILGPNGAGKTTVLRMLTGLLRPSEGRARVLGRDVWDDTIDAKRWIGLLPEDGALFDRLSAAELLEYHGLLRGMPPSVIRERAIELLDVLDLTAQASTLVADYSHGMRKKVGLASAMIHNPRVLFLDEPFEAIDPVSARVIRGVLQRYTAAGGTVVFSSHVLSIVEQVCSHVAIIDHGALVFESPTFVLRPGQLEDVFVASIGGVESDGTELSWLGSSFA